MVTKVSHHSLSVVLKNFKEVQNMTIEFHSGELGIEDGVLLKWQAMFGSILDSREVCYYQGILSFQSVQG